MILTNGRATPPVKLPTYKLPRLPKEIMYCLSQFCCFCFRHNVKLKLLSKITYRNTTFHKIAKAVIPELLFSKHNHLFSVCKKCETFIKDIYTFRQNCIKNILLMMKYVKQLQSFGSESGDMRVHVNSVYLPKIYNVINTDEDELDYVECEVLLVEDDIEVKNDRSTTVVECDNEIFENFYQELLTVNNLHNALENIGNEGGSSVLLAQTDDSEVIKIENDLEAGYVEEACEKGRSCDVDDIEMKIEIHDDFSEMYDRIKCESNDNLNAGTENVTDQLGPSEELLEKEDLSTRFEQCMICDKSIALCDTKQHELDHFRDEQPKCLKCGEYLANICTLKVHKIVHNEKNIYKCQQCKESFPDFKDLRKHSEIHRKTSIIRNRRPRRVENKEYRCGKCDKTFTNINSLRIHSLTHVERNTFKCEQCGKIFFKESSLNAHSVIHTGKVLYKCVKKTFNIRKHYECETCGKAFSKENDLNSHKLFHERRILYNCEWCEKLTPQRDRKVHVTHPIAGPSSRKCGICRKTFCGDPNEKPYLCEECGESFSEKERYELHQINHKLKAQQIVTKPIENNGLSPKD